MRQCADTVCGCCVQMILCADTGKNSQTLHCANAPGSWMLLVIYAWITFSKLSPSDTNVTLTS